ncbi:hypothetical protein M501DRAFT_1019783 [Patellaria atrata CBS 101060]|uniref:Uncharacterized protein n=1 Tax=Patellaria atrata CBS 101060 TaxID=1346257 RepID=A0A9P4S595_9PEZI|nr:hypothetical protein M501DRAFT_1019783 [Patellaria atrata CBS 101060]
MARIKQTARLRSGQNQTSTMKRIWQRDAQSSKVPGHSTAQPHRHSAPSPQEDMPIKRLGSPPRRPPPCIINLLTPSDEESDGEELKSEKDVTQTDTHTHIVPGERKTESSPPMQESSNVNANSRKKSAPTATILKPKPPNGLRKEGPKRRLVLEDEWEELQASFERFDRRIERKKRVMEKMREKIAERKNRLEGVRQGMAEMKRDMRDMMGRLEEA